MAMYYASLCVRRQRLLMAPTKHMYIEPMCNRYRDSANRALLFGSMRISRQCIHSHISPLELLRKQSISHRNFAAAGPSVQIRTLSNSNKPYEPSSLGKFILSIYEEFKFVFNSIRQITFDDISLWLLRTSAVLGMVHVTTEYGFRTFTCEGPSMEPTIIDGSYTLVLVERWSHRLFGLESDYDVDSEMCKNVRDEELKSGDHYNLSWVCGDHKGNFYEEWLSLLKGIWRQHFTSGLQRGDVIILNHPNREGTICKRIIGMPGDIVIRNDGGSSDSDSRVAIPPGHFWVEGDNSLQSLDSRDYGAIPASLTIGKVMCRLWPLRDYVWIGMDANGIHQWERIPARIGRGYRPMPADDRSFIGSYVLGTKR
ncbi:hypothetical protein ACHAWO_011754 [Cyclotella atomus]|uniref:Peptidase S26 domain-containing protein n=1 Tax=Cyclotella atomus TaxID=382360 RepID=A0ABD3MQ72_9STRA